jgi:hypothetical protein
LKASIRSLNEILYRFQASFSQVEHQFLLEISKKGGLPLNNEEILCFFSGKLSLFSHERLFFIQSWLNKLSKP